MDRRLPLFIPVLTVLGLALLIFWVGAPRPISGARLWGGPTDGSTRWTGWLDVRTDEQPWAGAVIQVVAVAKDGARARSNVVLDAEGQADIALDFGASVPGRFHVVIASHGEVLAEGEVALGVDAWRARASRRGGHLRTSAGGAIAIAPARGAFAVPFEGPLWIRLERPGRVALRAEGARVRPAEVTTDHDGVALATLTPEEHVVTLSARLASAAAPSVDLTTSVPVVPGALMVERSGDVLQISSPVARSEAFVTLVSENARLYGARVPLVTDAHGLSRGTLRLPPGLPERTWAVVESTRGAPAPERVGWPLFESRAEPAFTFDARDSLVLDGFPAARARERARQSKVRTLALALGLLGAACSAVLVFVGARRKQQELRAHLDAQLDPAGTQALNPPQSGWLFLAIFLIFLGFMVIAGVLGWRLR